MIDVEVTNGIAVAKMGYGKANVLDLEFCQKLVRVAEELEASDARAVVMTGSGSIFSAGVDLFRLLDGGNDYTKVFLPALSLAVQKIFVMKKPVVAAINGHAIAGGCLVAVACDYRIMVDQGAKIGVPELNVGVPFPGSAVEVLRHTVPPQVLPELIYLGRLYDPKSALEAGLVHDLVPAATLLSRAMDLADRLGSIPTVTFQITKMQLRNPAMGQAGVDPEELEKRVMPAWQSEEVMGAVNRYLDVTIGKKK